MSDETIVKIKAGLPKGNYNGLAPIGDDVKNDPRANRVAIVLLGAGILHVDGEVTTAELRILRIEAVNDPSQARVLRSLMRQVHEQRLGKRSLPGMGFDEDELGGLVDDGEDA